MHLLFLAGNITLIVWGQNIFKPNDFICPLLYCLLFNQQIGIQIVFSILTNLVGETLTAMGMNLKQLDDENGRILIEKYIASYDKIVDVTETLNSCFEIQLLLILVRNFSTTISYLIWWYSQQYTTSSAVVKAQCLLYELMTVVSMVIMISTVESVLVGVSNIMWQ
ncbi:Hypothetical protein NTJ_09568 [Nesidiocoris tenuis]|uniref:ABC transmembrane type-1 domain-containing protein n=1 Tax=Nesidiocoris tenuis TaxID=355587 RepID=A0ABN7AX43_9HEMI|nr:Hypothetical protein NTJ_09568 [Nesidiocoris tenuis]